MLRNCKKSFTPKFDHCSFGNFKGSSTVHYQLYLMNFITSNVNKRLEVTTVTIDVGKTLDLINHSTLTKKIISQEFHKGCVKWISFINLRPNRTRTNNKTSDEIILHCGVRQGTSLGPLLFLILVNENNISYAKIYKHVDIKTLACAHNLGQGNNLL